MSLSMHDQRLPARFWAKVEIGASAVHSQTGEDIGPCWLWTAGLAPNGDGYGWYWNLEPVTILVNIRRGNSGKIEAARTHCPQGHEYTPENTDSRIQAGRWKHRGCRACHREHQRQYVARKKEVSHVA